MDMNISAKSGKGSVQKHGLFDSIEIKGLSAKKARAFSSGRFAVIVRRLSRLLAFTPARVYGFASLSFGILTLFLHLGEYYFMQDPVVAVSSLIIGAVFAVLSLPLLISDKPICIAFQSLKLVDFIVFDFFSINRMQYSEGERRLSAAWGILFGFLLAAFGFFLPTEYAALLIIFLVLFVVSMLSPEFPYIFSLLVFPYLPIVPYSEYILAGFIVLTLVSFSRKVFVGKRMYALEIYDFLLLLFVLAVVLTGVILGGKSSTEYALLIILFIIGYIPAASVAVNRRLCDCIAGAVVTSSIPIAIYAIVKYIVDFAMGERTSATAFFASSAVLAAYLSTVIVFSLFLSVNRSRKIKKRYYFITFIINAIAIITTEYFALPIALLLCIAAFMIIRSKKIPPFFAIPLFLLPFGILFLPDSILLKLSGILPTSPSVIEVANGVSDSLWLFFDNLFFGIGANGFGEGAYYSHSTYLALGCRFGILAAIIFVLLIIIRFLHLGIFRKHYSDSTVSFYVDMCTFSAIAMLLLGSFADIFENIIMVYFFISIFATGSAALRVSKKERLERLSYYADSGSSDYAILDVRVK